MSDYYNLRPRPSVTAAEGFNVEQTPEGPGPMAAELATQVQEGQVPTVEVEMERRPESPQAVAQSMVSSSISLPDLTLISGLDDKPRTTREDTHLDATAQDTDMEPPTPLPSQDTSANRLPQKPSLAPNVVTGSTGCIISTPVVSCHTRGVIIAIWCDHTTTNELHKGHLRHRAVVVALSELGHVDVEPSSEETLYSEPQFTVINGG